MQLNFCNILERLCHKSLFPDGIKIACTMLLDKNCGWYLSELEVPVGCGSRSSLPLGKIEQGGFYATLLFVLIRSLQDFNLESLYLLLT